MNRILLALTILSAGAGGLLTAYQSTTQLQHEAQAVREAWLAQTQRAAVAQSEKARLAEHVRELKQTLAQPPAVVESALWAALQTNRADRLPPDLRERLLEELGFNWRSSPDFIVVSKETVRGIGVPAIRRGEFTDVAATVLALTPEERRQVEAAMQRVQADFKDWVSAHVQRSDPKEEVVAHYSLPDDPAMSQSISNNFVSAVNNALGRERTELILPSAGSWMDGIGVVGQPASMIIKRDVAGNEQRLKAEMRYPGGGLYSGYLPLPQHLLPGPFQHLFPNAWPDVAKREGFELPPEPEKK